MNKRGRAAVRVCAIALVATAAFFAAPAVVSSALAASGKKPLIEQRAFALPNSLREVSGLAVAGPNSVFAHDDEYAIIHEIDINNGEIIRSFALGKPTASGDFEGVTIANGRTYLVASNGLIYEAAIEEHGRRTPFNVFDTQIGSLCEIEGIAALTLDDSFLFACKQILGDTRRNRLLIYKWSIADRFSPPYSVVDLDLADPVPEKHRASFKASDLFRDPATGNILVLNSGGPGILELDAHGRPLKYIRLDRDDHPQPEGLAVLVNGLVAIADEGGKSKGRLSIYRLP